MHPFLLCTRDGVLIYVSCDRYQSRAFLLLPFTFNIGTIIGPMLGGQLADLADGYPDVFGRIDFFVKYPYAPPNIISAFIFICGLLSAWLCLEEVIWNRSLFPSALAGGLTLLRADATCSP